MTGAGNAATGNSWSQPPPSPSMFPVSRPMSSAMVRIIIVVVIMVVAILIMIIMITIVWAGLATRFHFEFAQCLISCCILFIYCYYCYFYYLLLILFGHSRFNIAY